ncbi:MAG: type II secretion system F family protein [Patescibacteria group bacterium]
MGVGEKTGKLDETLLYLGDFFADEVDNTAKNLPTILEPALLVVIAGMVLFLALAIIAPIYDLTGSVRR